MTKVSIISFSFDCHVRDSKVLTRIYRASALALIHAVETRTSSPLRVPRDPNTLQAGGVDNLFPAGEGVY